MECPNGWVLRVRVDGPVSFRVALPETEFRPQGFHLSDRVAVGFSAAEVQILEVKHDFI